MNYYDNLEKTFHNKISYKKYILITIILIYIVFCIFIINKMYLLMLIPIIAFFIFIYLTIYGCLKKRKHFFNIVNNVNQFKIEQYELKKQTLLDILKEENNMTPQKLEHMLTHYRNLKPRSILSGSFSVNLLVGLFAFYGVFMNFIHFNDGVLDSQNFTIQFSIFIIFMIVSFFTIFIIRLTFQFITGRDSKKELVTLFISILEDFILEYDILFNQKRSRREGILRNEKTISQKRRNGNMKPST